MHCPALLRFNDTARRLVAWCLLAALPILGLSSALVELLGSSHVHRQVATSVMDGWQDFRRAGHVNEGAPRAQDRAHAHALLERHHHALGDETVVALDGSGGDSLSGEATNVSGATVIALVALAGGFEGRRGEPASVTWPDTGPGSITSCVAARLERPPRA